MIDWNILEPPKFGSTSIGVRVPCQPGRNVKLDACIDTLGGNRLVVARIVHFGSLIRLGLGCWYT